MDSRSSSLVSSNQTVPDEVDGEPDDEDREIEEGLHCAGESSLAAQKSQSNAWGRNPHITCASGIHPHVSAITFHGAGTDALARVVFALRCHENVADCWL